MSRPRVAVTSVVPGHALEWLETACETTVHRGPALDREDAVAAFVGDAEGVLCLLANPVTDAVLAACPRLRVVAYLTTVVTRTRWLDHLRLPAPLVIKCNGRTSECVIRVVP